jgi:YesN/AraC family two-component response regulator
MFRVLLVDDEVVAVNALKRRVDWIKHTISDVRVANSMAQAQELFKNSPIDLMLCDIEMPQGSGLDLFEWVKLHYPETECIFVTCHPDFEYVRKAMQLGSLDYVLKPIDYEELDTILSNSVKRLQRKGKIVNQLQDPVLAKIIEHEKGKTGPSITDQVRQYVINHISETIFVDDIARVVHHNPQYLMRAFKKETGLPILEYITAERMRIAQELLLQTDFQINRVAECVGYENFSYFIKMIKRHTGLTPAAFRQKHKKEVT